MDGTAAAVAGSRRAPVRRVFLEHPEAGPALVIATVWMMLVFAPAAHIRIPHGEMVPTTSQTAGVNIWRMALRERLPSWMLMTIAMMGPAALAGLRHTALNSLNWRRGRAMTEFAAGYLAVWAAFGLAGLTVTAVIPHSVGWNATAIALAAACAWQLTPLKRRYLRDCHRSVPLPLRGWRAERSAVRFGVRIGVACLGSCWCFMLVMAVVPGTHILWTAALTGLITVERYVARPRRATRLVALSLGVAAACALGAVLASAGR